MTATRMAGPTVDRLGTGQSDTGQGIGSGDSDAWAAFMDIAQLSEKIIKGDRRALARAITLVESGRADHRAQAGELTEALKGHRQAVRIGLSGTPGVGKSSFIDAFGTMLTGQGLRVAVLGGRSQLCALRRLDPG